MWCATLHACLAASPDLPLACPISGALPSPPAAASCCCAAGPPAAAPPVSCGRSVRRLPAASSLPAHGPPSPPVACADEDRRCRHYRAQIHRLPSASCRAPLRPPQVHRLVAVTIASWTAGSGTMWRFGKNLVSSPLLASATYTHYIHGLGSRPNKLNTTQHSPSRWAIDIYHPHLVTC